MMKEISQKTFLSLLTLLIIISGKVLSQSRDTVLNMALSKPYFYNLIKEKDGKIFAGTAEGIAEIKGTTISHYGSAIGYLTLNKAGQPVIDSNGVKYYSEKKYTHLLPFPEMAREEYHASTDDAFYICSGGRLYIYDILPYEYSYPNHSFRTISKDLLGTYSGIYLKGKKIGSPAYPYTDGYIRQFGNRAFICNYNIVVLEKEALDSGYLLEGKNCFVFGPEKEFYNDIFPDPDNKHYYIATQKKLVRTDYNFKENTSLFESDGKNGPIGLINEDPKALFFFSDKELYALSYEDGKITNRATFKEPILAGVWIEKQVYVLTGKGLYRFNSGRQIEKLFDIEKAHTLISLSGSELIIGSDNGLYLFNIVNKELSVIIKGVEFNRRALYKNENAIYAGSLNGLYTIRLADLNKLVEENKANLKEKSVPLDLLLIVAIISVIFILLGVIVLKFKKKLKDAETIIESIKTPQESISREKIEEFIMNNLPNASIKTIMDEFKLNAQQVYAILKPDKPGSIIQQMRLEILKKMRAEKKSNQEISEQTGLSVSYLKKIKSN